MRGWNIVAAVILLCGGSAAPAAGPPPPICADRPGKATSACTVLQGHWQVETGFADWSLQKENGERDTSLAVGETVIKYGLSDASDIEIDLTPWQRATSQSPGLHESARGFGDVNFIYKQRLSSSDGSVQVFAMPVVKAPTAKHSLGNGKWEGGLLLPIGYAIPKSPLSFAVTPEVDWVANGEGHGHHAAMAQVISLGFAATDRLNLSAELWGGWDWDPAGTARQASADAAVAYLASDVMQLDAGANFGLNRSTPDVELYAGLSKRF